MIPDRPSPGDGIKVTDASMRGVSGSHENEEKQTPAIPMGKERQGDFNRSLLEESFTPASPGKVPGSSRLQERKTSSLRHKSVTTPGEGQVTTAGRRRASSSDSARRVGLLDMMKGEAMVISGILGKNPKKVEEGRHLMGKE